MINKKRKVLISVDSQEDFIRKNGKLTLDAEEIIEEIQNRIDSTEYDDIIITMDTHNKEDYEKSDEGKTFPIHCIEGTQGWRNVFKSRSRRSQKKMDKMFKNGKAKDFQIDNEFVFMKDKFSIWEGNKNFKSFMNNRYDEDTEFDIVGVAFDVCVFFNAEGMAKNGFKNVNVIMNATKSITSEGEKESMEKLNKLGVKIDYSNSMVEENQISM